MDDSQSKGQWSVQQFSTWKEYKEHRLRRERMRERMGIAMPHPLSAQEELDLKIKDAIHAAAITAYAAKHSSNQAFPVVGGAALVENGAVITASSKPYALADAVHCETALLTHALEETKGNEPISLLALCYPAMYARQDGAVRNGANNPLCGACRDFLAEYLSPDATIVTAKISENLADPAQLLSVRAFKEYLSDDAAESSLESVTAQERRGIDLAIESYEKYCMHAKKEHARKTKGGIHSSLQYGYAVDLGTRIYRGAPSCAPYDSEHSAWALSEGDLNAVVAALSAQTMPGDEPFPSSGKLQRVVIVAKDHLPQVRYADRERFAGFSYALHDSARLQIPAQVPVLLVSYGLQADDQPLITQVSRTTLDSWYPLASHANKVEKQ